jgi:hypothetical protein
MMQLHHACSGARWHFRTEPWLSDQPIKGLGRAGAERRSSGASHLRSVRFFCVSSGKLVFCAAMAQVDGGARDRACRLRQSETAQKRRTPSETLVNDEVEPTPFAAVLLAPLCRQIRRLGQAVHPVAIKVRGAAT